MKAANRLPRVWGKWTLKPNLTLIHRDAPWYEVDIERMRTSAETLDWIFQVRTLGWMKPQDLSDLIEAIDDLIRPQATLCSGGVERSRL